MSLLTEVRTFIFITLSMISSQLYAVNQGYADVVSPLLPAVVSISVIYQDNLFELPINEGSEPEEASKLLESLEQHTDEEAPQKPSSLGSGFIISADGYVVTNHHVIDKAKKIIVSLSDQRKLDAKLIGFDNRTDLALLKINSYSPLPFVNFGDSDKSRVGDFILAIGNPFGLGNTVTSGIISAQARNIRTDSINIVDNFIQVDAAINEGNSGGPIFNTQGEVIGISFFIVSPTGVNIGLGFAAPSSLAKPIIDQLMKEGKVHRGWIGVITESTEDGVGVIISGISKGGPAEKSGIEIGDVILKFDGKDITNNQGLPRIVAETPVGKKISCNLIRNGKPKKITIIVEEMKAKSS